MTRAFAFVSVKGGVGKTSLAITAAAGFAARKVPVAVVDADLTGTSLADALRLVAPNPVGGWHTEAEMVELRRRSQADVPWFDAWLFDPKKAPPRPVPWRHTEVDGIDWYPSSPHPKHIDRVLKNVRKQRTFDRFIEAFTHIADSLGDDGVVCVDVPPTTAGITNIAATTMNAAHVATFPVLVTTDDRNDLYRSAREFAHLRLSFPWTTWILNRAHRRPYDVRADLRQFLGPEWPGIEEQLQSFEATASLSGLFTRDGLGLGTAPAELLSLLPEEG